MPGEIIVVRKLLAQFQLTGAAADIYVPTVGAGNVVAGSTSIWFCNTDAAPRLLTLRYGVGVLTAANSLLDAAQMLAKETWVINEAEWSMAFKSSGARLQGFADVAATITVTIFGQETV